MKKNDSPSTESEDGTGFIDQASTDPDFDIFLEDIPHDVHDIEDPDPANSNMFTAPPEVQ